MNVNAQNVNVNQIENDIASDSLQQQDELQQLNNKTTLPVVEPGVEVPTSISQTPSTLPPQQSTSNKTTTTTLPAATPLPAGLPSPPKRFPIPQDAAQIGYNMLTTYMADMTEEMGFSTNYFQAAQDYQYTQTPEKVAEVNEGFVPHQYNLDLYYAEGKSGYQNWAANQRNEACWVYHPQSVEETQQIVRDINQHNDNLSKRKLNSFEIEPNGDLNSFFPSPSSKSRSSSSSSSSSFLRSNSADTNAPTTNKVKSMINHNALNNYQHIRVGGFGGSWGKLFADTNDVFIILDSMKQIYQQDPINRPDLVTVGAGVTNMELALWVEAPERGEYRHCYVDINTLMVNGTVAGVLATNSHGSSSKYSLLADSVEEVKLIDSKGNIVIYNRNEDPEKTMLACASLGLMGIVVEITLKLNLEQCEGFHVEGYSILLLPLMRKQPLNPKRKNPLKLIAQNYDYFILLAQPFGLAFPKVLGDYSNNKIDFHTFQKITSSWTNFIQYNNSAYFDIDEELGHIITAKYANRTLDDCSYGSTRDNTLTNIPQAYEWSMLDMTTQVQGKAFGSSLNAWHRKYKREMAAYSMGSLPTILAANIDNGTWSSAKTMHFSRHTDRKPLFDLSIVLKADDTTEWDNIYDFWRASYELIRNVSMENDFITPNIFTSIRIIKGSESPLAFVNGKANETFVSFDFGTWLYFYEDLWADFSGRLLDIGVEKGMHSDGSIPKLHWAKCAPKWFPEGKLEQYLQTSMKSQIDAVRPIIKESDPHGLFANDFLRNLFEL